MDQNFDLVQVTLKSQFQPKHALITLMQKWHHCLQWTDSISEKLRVRKAAVLTRRHQVEEGFELSDSWALV